MGADGHWLLIEKQKFDAIFPRVVPADAGLNAVTVLGVEAYALYHDTNGHDDSEYASVGLAREAISLRRRIKIVQEKGSNGVYQKEATGSYLPAVKIIESDERARLAEVEAHSDYPMHVKNLAALDWFMVNAEDHEVWT